MLILLSPAFLILYLVLSVYFFGNPIFAQERPGRNHTNFKILKFKTMTDERDSKGALLSDSARLTPLGKLIRRFSLDEMPQLFNVIKGDMSLVGPRPLLNEYLELYNPFEARRHEVRPGVTGWAQINGRNAISWEKKFELDIWYIDNLSFLLDMQILFKTLFNVLSGKGVTQQGHVTVGKFKRGNYPKTQTADLK